MLREPSPLDGEVKEDRHASQTSSPLFKLLPYFRRHPKPLAFSFLSILTASLTVLGIGTALRLFVDHAFSSSGSVSLIYCLGVFFAVISVMALASYGRLYWVTQLSEQIVNDLRKDLFSSLLRQNIPFFESHRTGEIQSRLTTDTTLLQIVLGTSLPIGIRNTFIIIGGLIMLFTTSPVLTLMILFITPLVLVPLLLYGRKVKAYSRLTQDKVASLSACIDDTFSAIRTVFAFCRESYMVQLFTDHLDETYQASIKRAEARARLTALVILVVFGAISVVLWYGVQEVIKGNLTAGTLSAFLFYAITVATSAGSLSEIHGDMLRAAGGMERIFEFLHLSPSLKHPSHPKALPSPLKGHIQFLNVEFAYPSRPHHLIFKDLTFEIFPGEKVAFSGVSGIGKTTLFNLLMRFYDPLKGEIRLDGIPLQQFDIHHLRNVFGLVPQDPFLFTTTVFENIRFAKLDATEEEIKAAAEAAYADEFITHLPQGYHTPLGEKGVTLSGGQRQRIAIARAILKNPSILLLDEATSALDTGSEKKIQYVLKTLRHNRTTLIIAHRKSSLQQADRVIEV